MTFSAASTVPPFLSEPFSSLSMVDADTNVTPRTMAIGGALIGHGAQPDPIAVRPWRTVIWLASAQASRWPMCSAAGPAISAPRKRPVVASA